MTPPIRHLRLLSRAGFFLCCRSAVIAQGHAGTCIPTFLHSMSGMIGYLSIGISPNKSRDFRRSSQLLKRRRATTNGHHLSVLD
jgi:hypothetical protein